MWRGYDVNFGGHVGGHEGHGGHGGHGENCVTIVAVDSSPDTGIIQFHQIKPYITPGNTDSVHGS